MSYYEICEFLREDNTTLVWDNEQMVPFAYREDQWVGFDDERSLKTKVFVKDVLMIFYLFQRLIILKQPGAVLIHENDNEMKNRLIRK